MIREHSSGYHKVNGSNLQTLEERQTLAVSSFEFWNAVIANQRSAQLGPQRPLVTKVRRAKRGAYGKLNRGLPC